MDLRIVDLISYYPEYLKENKEYNAICDAENPEFNLLIKRIRQMEKNIHPQTADEYGIEKFESWLGIPTNHYLPLEQRRNAVIAKLNETLPFTEIRLQRMLAAIVGWGHFHYERHGALVQVVLDKESLYAIQPVRDLLERILPMNLHYEVARGITSYTEAFVGAPYHTTVIVETEVSDG